MTLRIILPIVAALLPGVADAEVTLSAIFSDHAVLQCDRPLPVWGTAQAGENVRVSLGDARAETQADNNGQWLLQLPAQSASSSPQALQVSGGSETIQRSDILIGEVWHASGQSNMAMTVGSVARSLKEVRELLATCEIPAIRFLRINDGPSLRPLPELGSKPTWQICSAKSVTSFSAAAFFFAKQIHDELEVPVGIINSARGGTPIEPFIPRSAFVGHPTLVRELELADREDLEGIWRLAGGVRARDANWLPGRLFASRIAPIRRFAVRGCLWYQGESNCGDREDPREYQHKMRALISGWRQQLGRSDLPFYFVQLPGSGARENWPYLREQQRLAADVSNSGMVVTIDLEHPDIHPPNKIDVGHRLARWALANQYGKAIPFSGPMFSESQIDGNRVIVDFEYATPGLMVATKVGLEPPREQSDGRLNHFELSDAGGVWHPAQAVIQGNQVVVTSDKVQRPFAVRYAYAVSPENCNLFNRNGLPASPFCSHPELLKCDPGLPDL
jgi:sialate O-acetylesterase